MSDKHSSQYHQVVYLCTSHLVQYSSVSLKSCSQRMAYTAPDFVMTMNDAERYSIQAKM